MGKNIPKFPFLKIWIADLEGLNSLCLVKLQINSYNLHPSQAFSLTHKLTSSIYNHINFVYRKLYENLFKLNGGIFRLNRHFLILKEG